MGTTACPAAHSLVHIAPDCADERLLPAPILLAHFGQGNLLLTFRFWHCGSLTGCLRVQLWLAHTC